MKTMRLAVIAAAFLTSMSASAAVINVGAGSLTQCPTVGLSHSCALTYRFNSNGSIDTLADSTVPSTDGVEDTLVGVFNNSGHTVNSIFLNGGTLDIFGFDSDGQSTITGTGPGATYFGQYLDAAGVLLGVITFSPDDAFKGTVNFPGLTNGGSAWFVLEEQVDFSAPPVPRGTVPEPGSMALLSLGFGAFGFIRRKKTNV